LRIGSYLALCAGIFLLSGCRKKQPQQAQPSLPLLENRPVDESRLVDIPFPIYDSSCLLHEQGGNCAFRLQSRLNINQLIQFYEEEMDRLGWIKQVSIKTAEEQYFLFEKPRGTCSIRINADGTITVYRALNK
jgi:hypothetical protein